MIAGRGADDLNRHSRQKLPFFFFLIEYFSIVILLGVNSRAFKGFKHVLDESVIVLKLLVVELDVLALK